jgi:DNA-binding NtrC family response regulator
MMESVPTDAFERSSPYALYVLAGGKLASHRLPDRGVIRVGRAAHNDIVLDDPSVSRNHARIHVGDAFGVEDLGSSNGTRVGTRHAERGPAGPEDTSETRTYRVEPHSIMPIAPGDAVHVGSVLLVVRPQSGIIIVPEAAERSIPCLPGATSAVVVDPAMQKVFALAECVAPSSLCVLLLGEAGVGKQVVAETIHRRSTRASGAFLKLDCRALPETLLESQLFGHEAVPSLGGAQRKPGLLEMADGGTLFLDEVGELPAAAQDKLVRVLEAGEVLQAGAVGCRKFDVRFLAATTRDLQRAVERGHFRGDLFYRLTGIVIVVPPLRERKSEVGELARAFIGQSAQARGLSVVPELTAEALEVLRRYRFPGNVRELRHVVEQALLVCGAGPIRAQHLSLGKALSMSPPAIEQAPPSSPPFGLVPAELKTQIVLAERERIAYALERCAGNQTQAARLLGISRRTLIGRLDAYGLPRPRKKSLSSG